MDGVNAIVVEHDDAGERTLDESEWMQLADVVTSQLGVANRARQTLRHLRQTTLRQVDVSQQSRVKLHKQRPKTDSPPLRI